MRRVLGHLLVRSLIHSHFSLIHLLRSAPLVLLAHSKALFFYSLRCAHSAHGKEVYVFETNASFSCNFNPQCGGGPFTPLSPLCFPPSHHQLQLNPAITDLKGPTIFIHYRRISAVANTGNMGNKEKFTVGTEKLIPL